jgi:hypothetical protein
MTQALNFKHLVRRIQPVQLVSPSARYIKPTVPMLCVLKHLNIASFIDGSSSTTHTEYDFNYHSFHLQCVTDNGKPHVVTIIKTNLSAIHEAQVHPYKS